MLKFLCVPCDLCESFLLTLPVECTVNQPNGIIVIVIPGPGIQCVHHADPLWTSS